MTHQLVCAAASVDGETRGHEIGTPPETRRTVEVPDHPLRDEDGIRQTYAAHGAELYGFACRRLADRALAEEAVQETFLRAWQAGDRFDPASGSIRTWLFAIMRNVTIDLLRARSVRPQAADLDVGDIEMTDDATERVLQRWQIEEALRRLTPHHRAVIVETVLRDRPYAEVAAEAGVPEGTVRSRLYYGLRALRVALEEVGWSA